MPLNKVFSFYPFTYIYRQPYDWSDNILFRYIIQPQANRENYDSEIFKQAENEDNMKCTI